MNEIKDDCSNNLLPTLLLVLFIGLKLGGVIQWSWWWVLSPFWIQLLFLALIFGVIFVVDLVSKK